MQEYWVFRVASLSGASCFVVATSRQEVFGILVDVATMLDIEWYTGCHDSYEKYQLLCGSTSTPLPLFRASAMSWDLPESKKGTLLDLTLIVKV